jgi:hypothetical protein
VNRALARCERVWRNRFSFLNDRNFNVEPSDLGLSGGYKRYICGIWVLILIPSDVFER